VAGAVSTCTPAGICGHVCLVDHAPCAAGCCPRTEARSVAISQAAACSVDAAGAVHCAGDNFTGLLGLPPRVVTGVVAVSGLPPARKVVVGDAYACALTHPGDVYCWGDGHRPSTGQQQALDRTLRHRLGFEGMVDLFGGSKGACALRPNGDLHCWGRLGDAGDQPRLVARGVRGGAVGGTDLAGQHLCIVGVRGDLRCMGNNDHRQLGSSDPLARGPIVPHGLDRDVIAVVAGHRHTCALVGTDEPSKTRTLCWGFHAALGSIDESRSAVHPTPTPVAGDHSFIALGAGGHHTCGLSADGSVRCWGSRPQLSFHETPAFIGGLSDVLSITSGNDTTCARTASDLRCFGRGYARTHQPSVDPLP
jgi:alpha-tubulin suppressor-like RCC1 family protein